MSNQLVKKNPAEGYQNVFPKTFIDAIKDKESGVSLQEILQGFNMYFLSYNGSRALTRCKIPTVLRKEGLWITYVLYDHTVVTEWYNSDQIDDSSWGMDSNWRVASNNLIGDVSVSADGYWVINGEKTEAKAQGEQGVTPLLRIGANNKLQVSYNAGKAWRDISDYIVPRFRYTRGTTNDTAVMIQISMDLGKTWTNLSNEITNNLRISRYIGINESLPTSGVAEGTVYMKGPYYDEGDTSNANPIYRMWIYAWKDNTLAWQDNGEFTSISAGVVQETGNSETEVMSQKSVTDELTKINTRAWGIEFTSKKVQSNNYKLWEGNIEPNTKFYVKISADAEWSRIILIYNNDNNNRLVDSVNVPDITDKWHEYTLSIPVTALGLVCSGTNCNFYIEVKTESGDISELKNQQNLINESILDIKDKTNSIYPKTSIINGYCKYNSTTSNNYELVKELNFKKGEVVRFKVDVEGNYNRIVVNANNNASYQLLDTNNVDFVNKGFYARTLTQDVTVMGLYADLPAGSKATLYVDVQKGDFETMKDFVSDNLGYRRESKFYSSNTLNALNDLYIKKGEEFFLKIEVLNSYTRIVVNYNGNTDLRLVDTISNNDAVNTYIKFTAPETITQLGVYITEATAKLIVEKRIDKDIDTSFDILFKKKWYACGDSFTRGGWTYPTSQNTFQDSPYAGEYKVYPFFIGRRTGIEVHNIAVGGMSMCAKRSNNDGNSFTIEGTEAHPTALYKTIPEDADYITLYFGINDNNYGCPLGTINDTDNQTFYGAWNNALTWLIQNRPHSKIGIIITNGSAPRFTQAERELAVKFGIPYLDLELDKVRVPYFLRQNERTDVLESIRKIRDKQNAINWIDSDDINDANAGEANYHPNAECHEFESTIIESWLRTL